MQLSLIEKEVLKFLCNFEQFQEQKVNELLELWRRYRDLEYSSLFKQALEVFFKEKDLMVGRNELRYFLLKLDASLLEMPVWSVEELLNQSRLLIKESIVKRFTIDLNEITFKGNTEEIERNVRGFLQKIQNLEDVKIKVWDFSVGVSEEMLNQDILPSPFPKLVPNFQKKRLYFVAGFPGEGKTFFLINLADFFIKKGYSVLHISLETGISELLSRYLSLWTGNEIKCWTPEIFDRVYFEGIKNLRIIEGVSFLSVSIIEQFLSINPTDVVLLDYIDLLSSFRGMDNMFLEFSEIARSLYNIAKRREVCIISASQLNREGEISRSFGKKEICDGLFVLKKLSSNELQIYVEKLRYAPDKVFGVFKYDFSKGKIYFSEEELKVESR